MPKGTKGLKGKRLPPTLPHLHNTAARLSDSDAIDDDADDDDEDENSDNNGNNDDDDHSSGSDSNSDDQRKRVLARALGAKRRRTVSGKRAKKTMPVTTPASADINTGVAAAGIAANGSPVVLSNQLEQRAALYDVFNSDGSSLSDPAVGDEDDEEDGDDSDRQGMLSIPYHPAGAGKGKRKPPGILAAGKGLAAKLPRSIAPNASRRNSATTPKGVLGQPDPPPRAKKPPKTNTTISTELYCICRKPWDGKQFMIECDMCREWFHGKCVGVRSTKKNMPETYHCAVCKPPDLDAPDPPVPPPPKMTKKAAAAIAKAAKAAAREAKEAAKEAARAAKAAKAAAKVKGGGKPPKKAASKRFPDSVVVVSSSSAAAADPSAVSDDDICVLCEGECTCNVVAAIAVSETAPPVEVPVEAVPVVLEEPPQKAIRKIKIAKPAADSKESKRKHKPRTAAKGKKGKGNEDEGALIAAASGIPAVMDEAGEQPQMELVLEVKIEPVPVSDPDQHFFSSDDDQRDSDAMDVDEDGGDDETAAHMFAENRDAGSVFTRENDAEEEIFKMEYQVTMDTDQRILGWSDSDDDEDEEEEEVSDSSASSQSSSSGDTDASDEDEHEGDDADEEDDAESDSEAVKVETVGAAASNAFPDDPLVSALLSDALLVPTGPGEEMDMQAFLGLDMGGLDPLADFASDLMNPDLDLFGDVANSLDMPGIPTAVCLPVSSSAASQSQTPTSVSPSTEPAAAQAAADQLPVNVGPATISFDIKKTDIGPNGEIVTTVRKMTFPLNGEQRQGLARDGGKIGTKRKGSHVLSPGISTGTGPTAASRKVALGRASMISQGISKGKGKIALPVTGGTLSTPATMQRSHSVQPIQSYQRQQQQQSTSAHASITGALARPNPTLASIPTMSKADLQKLIESITLNSKQKTAAAGTSAGSPAATLVGGAGSSGSGPQPQPQSQSQPQQPAPQKPPQPTNRQIAQQAPQQTSQPVQQTAQPPPQQAPPLASSLPLSSTTASSQTAAALAAATATLLNQSLFRSGFPGAAASGVSSIMSNAVMAALASSLSNTGSSFGPGPSSTLSSHLPTSSQPQPRPGTSSLPGSASTTSTAPTSTGGGGATKPLQPFFSFDFPKTVEELTKLFSSPNVAAAAAAYAASVANSNNANSLLASASAAKLKSSGAGAGGATAPLTSARPPPPATIGVPAPNVLTQAVLGAGKAVLPGGASLVPPGQLKKPVAAGTRQPQQKQIPPRPAMGPVPSVRPIAPALTPGTSAPLRTLQMQPPGPITMAPRPVGPPLYPKPPPAIRPALSPDATPKSSAPTCTAHTAAAPAPSSHSSTLSPTSAPTSRPLPFVPNSSAVPATAAPALQPGRPEVPAVTPAAQPLRRPSTQASVPLPAPSQAPPVPPKPPSPALPAAHAAALKQQEEDDKLSDLITMDDLLDLDAASTGGHSSSHTSNGTPGSSANGAPSPTSARRASTDNRWRHIPIGAFRRRTERSRRVGDFSGAVRESARNWNETLAVGLVLPPPPLLPSAPSASAIQQRLMMGGGAMSSSSSSSTAATPMAHSPSGAGEGAMMLGDDWDFGVGGGGAGGGGGGGNLSMASSAAVKREGNAARPRPDEAAALRKAKRRKKK
ncbi:Lysine-specific demethylase 7A [Geranomyces variabilis]|uniref:Lysine-specific demethylase 7A n=1 Tax=Geranomyces variabilis TaxID=109894 RepID=A0AAD5XM46_9FUNG|nr:Lysine-specific demethylase 7A [Geranomyces variabilis]